MIDDKVVFRLANENDSKDIADLHIKSFPNFFLTSLGNNFLNRFYKGILKNQKGVGIIAVRNNDIIGFAIGCLKQEGFYTRILRENLIGFIYSTILIVLNKPGILLKIFRHLKYRPNLNFKTEDLSCLLSICINPDFQSLGLGKILLKYFENLLKSKNKFSYYLTTDAEKNDSVNRFYTFNNLKLIGDYTIENRKMNVYFKDNL